MSRPTNLYPDRPKLEHFFLVPSNLKAFTETVAPALGTAVPDYLATHFQRLSEAAYASYLGSHTQWLNALDSVDVLQHEHALRRRALEHYREVVSVDDESTRARTREQISVPHYPGLKLNVVTQAKVAHPPVLSTQPHQAEKRANRKKARDARVKVQANAAEAKAEILALKTVPLIKEQRLAVQKVAELRPLHKAEEVAAKSAAARASLIMKASPDLVPEVRPDDGWKLVTRKKGDKSIVLATTTKMGAAGTQLHHANVQGDPALVRGAGRLLAATTRAPTSTGVR